MSQKESKTETSVIINGKVLLWIRYETPCDVKDLLGWLDAQVLFPKVYFETQEGDVIAGAGSLMESHALPTFGSKISPEFFGGFDFMTRRSNHWKEFPSTCFFLPWVEVRKRGDQTFLCLNHLGRKKNPQVRPERPTRFKQCDSLRSDSPSFVEWDAATRSIVSSIQKGAINKVVLARKTTLKTGETLSPYALLKALKGANRFAFQFREQQTLIGNSPETLYRRVGSNLESFAVAGTRRRGVSADEEKRLELELMRSKKERHEHEMVREMIAATLRPLVLKLKMDPPMILKTERVQHLFSSLSATLSPDCSDLDLLQALHPTAALGGMPRKASLEMIKAYEPFDRGWYGAPVGLISSERAHFLVAIRSALVENQEIALFSGAGIVEGSNSKGEWEELDHKIEEFLNLICR